MTQPTPDAIRAHQLILNCLTGRAVCGVPRPADEATGLLEAFRAAVLREAADVAASELLQDDTGTPEDEAYNQGVRDAVAAINRRMAEEARS